MNAGRTEQDDDWLIRSMKRYESLYMFELPQPTKCIEWSLGGTAICVAGYSNDASTEVTQLALPGKLLPSRDKTHWAKRDFTLINGALSQTAITSLKYLSSTEMLASAGKKPVITLWKADSVDLDCLAEVGKLDLTLPPSTSHSDHTHTLIDAHAHSPHTVLTATSSSLCTVQTIDLATRKIVFTVEAAVEERVHGLAFIHNSENVFVSCSGDKGRLQVWDSRSKSTKQHAGQASDSRSLASFGFAVSCDSSPTTKLALLSSEDVQLYDMRECKEPIAKSKLEEPGSQRSWFGRTTHAPCIKFSENDSNLVSISGFTAGVSVYNYAKWTTTEKVAVPIFIHSGHEEDSAAAHVIVHSWQPNTPATILSSDSEGSLHAWQWKTSDSI